MIKYSANQKYTTDAVSGAIFRELCRMADVPVQEFHNRSDMIGGSTLGNISGAQVPMNTVDIGLPQLAMHSSYETAAPADVIAEYNRLYNTYGWYSNVDFTDDPTKIRWSAFLSDDRYKGQVGIYEGAALHKTGAYRPTEDSMMNEDAPYYNAPSRWAIYKRIMELSGETASFEKFMEYDAVNRSKMASSKALRTRSDNKPHHGAPPIVVR